MSRSREPCKAGRRQSWGIAPLLASLALTGTACEPEAPPPTAVGVRDSAGIEIVENREALWPNGAGWRLSEEPALRVGVLESAAAYRFLDVVDVVRLSDGRFVVANNGSGELQFFDSTGAFMTAVGTRGSDPGEFAVLLHLWRLPADTLVTFDWSKRRVSFFDPRGALVHAFSLTTTTEAPAAPFPVGPIDASFLVNKGSMLESVEPSAEGLMRDSSEYLLVDRTGAVLESVGSFPGRAYLVSTEPAPIVTEAPFSPQPVAAVHGDGFYFGSGDSYQIAYYTRHGELRRLIRKAHPRIRVTVEDIERYKQSRLQRARNAADRRRIARHLRELSFPETLPAYDDLQVDSQGNLWVADFSPPGDLRPTRSVFDPAGRFLGTVQVPARFDIYQIGSDFLLGSWRDEFGVQHVHLYRLIKTVGTE